MMGKGRATVDHLCLCASVCVRARVGVAWWYTLPNEKPFLCTHHLMPSREESPSNCVKSPERTIRQAAWQPWNATLYFKNKKTKERQQNVKAKSDDPLKLQSDHGWCASPNAHTGAKGFCWHNAIHVFLECMAKPMEDKCQIHGITMETVRLNHFFVEDDSQRSALW